MARDIDVKIDKALMNLDKTAKKGIISGLKESGDRVQREIKRTKRFIDRTSKLRASILRQPVNEKELSVTIIANTTDPNYGKFLNDGTRYITARRFMEEGRDKVLPQFESIFVKHLNRAIDRG